MKLKNKNIQQGKKDVSSLSGKHLESRSKNRGRQLRESMPVDADNHPVDKKLKCTNCDKKFKEIQLIIECPDCYILGAEKEREKAIKQFEKMIDKHWNNKCANCYILIQIKKQFKEIK